MRINSLVSSFLKQPGTIKKIEFMQQLNGGWERWFQLELAYYYTEAYYKPDNYALTEVRYSHSNQRCDLVFKNDTTHYTDVIELEIKCQTLGQSLTAFGNAIWEDIEKMRSAGKPIYVLGVLQDTTGIDELNSALNREIHGLADYYIPKGTNVGYVLAIKLPSLSDSKPRRDAVNDTEMEEE